jgi:hypothetical protein
MSDNKSTAEALKVVWPIEFMARAATFTSTALGLVTALACGAPAHAAEPPMWQRPLPGTAAILGDDGGGEDMETMCDTAEHWREWLDATVPSAVDGCARYSRGLPVVIDGDGVVFDRAVDAPSSATTGLPLVKIHIPSKHVSGYVQMLGGIHPIIPAGTLVYLAAAGTDTLRLASAPDVGLDSGPDIGKQATAKVLRYDPSTGDRSLYVKLLDGPQAGKRGWVFDLAATGADGKPVGMFAGSVVDISPRQTPPAAPPVGAPDQRHEWSGQNGWEIVFAKIAGGQAEGDCSLTWNSGEDTQDHILLWVWNNAINLSVSFIGTAAPGSKPGPVAGLLHVQVSIDGRVVTERPFVDSIVRTPDHGLLMVAEAMPVAWDNNDPGRDNRLQTEQIFDLLRGGRTLTIKADGQTFTESLAGVGSALDLFGKCINYHDRKIQSR